MKAKAFFFALALSLALTGAFMWLRGGYVTALGLTGFSLSTLFYGIALFLATYFVLRMFEGKAPRWMIVAVLLIGTLFWDAVALVRSFEPEYVVRSLPALVEFGVRIAAIGLGALFFGLRGRTLKGLVAAFSLAGLLWVSFSGAERYASWLNPKIEATYAQERTKIIEELRFLDSEGRIVNLDDLQKKYAILYFWDGDAAESAPSIAALQRLYERYADHSDVGVYAVYCADGASPVKCIGNGFTGPGLSVDTQNEGFSALRVRDLPKAIVLAKTGEGVLYNANLEKVAGILDTYILQ